MAYKNVREQVTDQLRIEVLLGKYEPGEAIRELPLAERYQVSRGPIRDALLQLSQEGLLDFVPNKGARVAAPWPPELAFSMAKIRFELESYSIKNAISNPPTTLLTELRQNLRMFQIACKENIMDQVVQLDLEFHRTFIKAGGHPGLEAVWLPLLGGFRLPYSRHKDLIESYEEHHHIVVAIEKGNKTETTKALKANVLDPFKLK